MTGKPESSEESDIGENEGSVGYYAELPIDSLVLDEQNVRANPAGLANLKQNIASQGLINPLTVRPLGKGQFGVIAGGLRMQAASALNITHVPCFVREDLADSDAGALSLSLSENINRGSISKGEIRDKVSELVEMVGIDDAGILLGRSSSWVVQVKRTKQLEIEVKASEVDIGDVSPFAGQLIHKIMYRAYPGHPRSRAKLANEIKGWPQTRLKEMNLYLTGHASLRNIPVADFLEEFEHRQMISIPHFTFIGRIAAAIRTAMKREKHPPTTLSRIAMERYLETEGYLDTSAVEVGAERVQQDTTAKTKEGG